MKYKINFPKNIFLLVFILFHLYACQKIKATNTFDPDSGDYLITPTNFKVINQIGDEIEMEWTKVDGKITHYLITKHSTGQYIKVSKDSSKYIDKGIQVGVNYTYTLIAFADRNNGAPIALNYRPQLILLSKDPSGITGTSAVFSTDIISIAGFQAMEYGFYYKVINSSSQLSVFKTGNTGPYSLSVSNLISKTNYQVTPYVKINNLNIIYGKTLFFTTK